jgi:hypothetical protein
MSVHLQTAGAALKSFEQSGFAIIGRVLSPEAVVDLLEATRAYADPCDLSRIELFP